MASIADVYVTLLPETSRIGDGIRNALLKADRHVVAGPFCFGGGRSGSLSLSNSAR